ncbi:MAG: helix-turn-helix domain-containing protein, partial [Gammaproteobacteria bacterium]
TGPDTSVLEITDIYAMFWRLVDLQVHRYGSAPTGELLIVLTIVLLDAVDSHPTVTELSDITNMPKSSVSRYVSTEMGMGFVEEIIDPRDRRRRLLRPTQAAREELAWHRDQVLEIARMKRAAFARRGESSDAGAEMKTMMRKYSHGQA